MSDSPIESTKAEMSFDPHCEDCCDPVTPCLVHTPRVALPRGAEPEPPLTEEERSHLVTKLRENYPRQGCQVCDRLLAKLESQ